MTSISHSVLVQPVFYSAAMKIGAPQSRQTRWTPYLSVIVWLCFMAGLFAWKGASFDETRSILLFLDQPVPSSTSFWWGGAVVFGVLAVAGLGRLLYSWFIRR